MQLLDCRIIKEEEYQRLKKKIKKPLTLAILQIGFFKENELYLNSKKNLATSLGITIQVIKIDETATEEQIKEKINELNHNENIHGIMIQKPILSKFSYQELIDYIEPKKDIESLTTVNKAKWESNDIFLPCTARAVLKILDYYQISLLNKKIAILGKGDLAAMPLYQVLKKTNQVYIYDSKTENLKDVVKNSDVVIVAIGKAGYLTSDYFKENQVVIDIGTNYIEGKLIGDILLPIEKM